MYIGDEPIYYERDRRPLNNCIIGGSNSETVVDLFTKYFTHDMMPEGIMGFGVCCDPRTGYETVEILVDERHDVEDFKRRFARWLKTPLEGCIRIAKVPPGWEDPARYLYRFSGPVVPLDDLAEIEVAPGPAPVPHRRLTPAGVALHPPFWVEFCGPATGRQCMHAGPFEDYMEAFRWGAARTGGIAPRNAFVQVKDRDGFLAIVT